MENEQHSIVCREVQHGTNEYRQTVALRDEVLRKPLGLAFTPEELADEKQSLHLACWRDDRLAATVVLRPLSDTLIRMRQLVVATELQGMGIGGILVHYAESVAKRHAYREIVLHARETAVRFYEKLGYTRQGDRFTEVTIPHYEMRKALDDLKEA